MKVKKTGLPGEIPHQYDLKPAGKVYARSTKAVTVALENATYKPVKFEAAKKTPDAKETKQVTKVAFKFFQKENKAID
jgi:hypothetical protein